MAAPGVRRSILAASAAASMVACAHITAVAPRPSLPLLAFELTASGQKAVRLELLDLADTRITDLTARRLAPLVRLSSLSLARTAVTDAGVSSIQGLAALREIDLSETRITDGFAASICATRHCRPGLGPCCGSSPRSNRWT